MPFNTVCDSNTLNLTMHMFYKNINLVYIVKCHDNGKVTVMLPS